MAEAAKAAASYELPEGTDTSSITKHLSPSEAQHGFKTALAILAANPRAASVAMDKNSAVKGSACKLSALAHAHTSSACTQLHAGASPPRNSPSQGYRSATCCAWTWAR